MHWKLKATLQNMVARLPSSLSYSSYYWLQRHFGGLRRFNPTRRLGAAVETCRHLQRQGKTAKGKVFFEVGTGRVPVVPLGYWLMGAEKTITIDLNPYLKEELVVECLRYLAEHESEIPLLIGEALDSERWQQLLEFARRDSISLPEFLQFFCIEYIAPGDAAATGLPPQSIDYHTSFTVFEHIPCQVLNDILVEGNRLLREGGLCIHSIDYSDHFSHSDSRISAINFLQYSAAQWDQLAGNRYMYMNRLRHDDFLELYQAVGHEVLHEQTTTDARAQRLLSDGSLRLDSQFAAKSAEVLATTWSWIVSRPPTVRHSLTVDEEDAA